MKPGPKQGDGVLIPQCTRCGRPNGACSLRCPTLNMTPGWYERSQLEWEALPLEAVQA